MNTHQLECCITCDEDMNKTIIGVYASDRIPNEPVSPPYGFIVNTHPYHLPGEHWLAFFVDKHGTLESFDSYGNIPSAYSERFDRLMAKFTRLEINRKRLQSSNSNVCGQYCLFYLMCRSRGYSMADILTMFNHTWEDNDQFVYTFINDRFNCCMNNLPNICQSCIKLL